LRSNESHIGAVWGRATRPYGQKGGDTPAFHECRRLPRRVKSQKVLDAQDLLVFFGFLLDVAYLLRYGLEGVLVVRVFDL